MVAHRRVSTGRHMPTSAGRIVDDRGAPRSAAGPRCAARRRPAPRFLSADPRIETDDGAAMATSSRPSIDLPTPDGTLRSMPCSTSRWRRRPTGRCGPRCSGRVTSPLSSASLDRDRPCTLGADDGGAYGHRRPGVCRLAPSSIPRELGAVTCQPSLLGYPRTGVVAHPAGDVPPESTTRHRESRAFKTPVARPHRRRFRPPGGPRQGSISRA
jgi:hypothetical protein